MEQAVRAASIEERKAASLVFALDCMFRPVPRKVEQKIFELTEGMDEALGDEYLGGRRAAR